MRLPVCLLRLLGFCLLLGLSPLVTGQEPQNPAPENGSAAAEEVPAQPVQDGELREPEADDLVIENYIRERFLLNEALRNVYVQSSGGVVELTGEVLKNAHRDIAERLAQGAPGVVAVENQIEVSQDVRERAVPALEQAREKLRRILGAVPLLLIGLTILVSFVLLARWLSNLWLIDRLVPRHRFTNNLIRQGIYYAGLLAGLAIVLDLLDATAWVGALLGTAGVVGLVVGFGVRDLVENQFSSVLLSLRQPFSPNDHVVIDGKYEGKVVSLSSRATVLMTLDGNHLRLPNSLVFKSVILNYSRNEKRQFNFSIGVGLAEDLKQAQALGVSVIQGMAGVLKDPAPMALIVELGESSAILQYLGWVNQNEVNVHKVRSEAIRLVKLALEEAEMDLPEPIYRISIAPGADSPSRVPAPAPQPPVRRSRTESREQGDVSADHFVDELVDRDRAENCEENLLDQKMPRE